MQTSSTLFLLANFLAVSVTAGISALGQSPSAALLETPLQSKPSNQRMHILSTNRGSGRIDAGRLAGAATAWRGSGRIQSDLETVDNNQTDVRLAWRGSGRAESDSPNEPDTASYSSNPVGPTVAWRGSGRLEANQTGVNVSA